ncbi:hypothetical protein JOY44_01115 [Phormidium sp. CLA17]|uniref:hypothetical protein n=1 Tax=Leptolyngbya sp. Cla-17 TaxID=2803751 RepID=UPI0019313A09|nr:hypothetical protein [Leptolyngbya sp. Cla-17]MBM0740255.1 hypothetical protein [Leptolyngbya sp. Cla-17]
MGLMIRQVSEQIVYRPLEELRYFYFVYSRGAFLLLGYPRLFYMATNIAILN